MKYKKIITIVTNTILIFLSVSFLYIIPYLNSHLFRHTNINNFNIGFPFKYYYEFYVELPIPNSGWNLLNLILDFIIILFITSIITLSESKEN